MLNMKATMLTAHQHETAFAFFNARLFDNQLPDCVISLGSMNRARGMYRYGFYASTGEGRRDEIVMNPETFSDLRDYLSTLVHEQAHLWQYHLGKPGKNGYHNKEWAAKMLSLGLPPYAIREPEKMTGIRVSHTVQEGGAFDVVCGELLRGGFALTWTHESEVAPHLTEEELEEEKQQEKRKTSKARSKTPFFCEKCGGKAWAKDTARLVCGQCWMPMHTEADVVRSRQNVGQAPMPARKSA